MAYAQVSRRNNKRRSYNRLKSKGICTSCYKNPAVKGKVSCEECAKEKAKYSKEYCKTHKRKKFTQEGEQLAEKMLLEFFGEKALKEFRKAEVLKLKKWRKDNLEKVKKQRKAHYDKNKVKIAENNKIYYNFYEGQGLCPNCKQHRPVKTKTLCWVCSRRGRKRYHEKKKGVGGKNG